MAKSNELEEKEVRASRITARGTIIVGLMAAILAFAGTFLSTWMNSQTKIKEIAASSEQTTQQLRVAEQEQTRLQMQSNREAFAFFLENQDKIQADDPAEQKQFREVILQFFPPETAVAIFDYLISQTDDDAIWIQGKSAATEKASLQPVYLFTITPVQNVNPDDVETMILENVFPDLQVYQRNVRNTSHSLFRGETHNEQVQFVWMLNLDLVGSGSATSGVEKVFNQMAEKLTDRATVSRAFIKTPQL